MEYSKLDREAGTDDVAGEPRQDRSLEGWPSHGGIKFSRFSMAYRVGLPNVLADVSLKIRPEERVGICGRTGAGKSSFLTALLRLNDYHKGKIWYENAPPPPPLISFFVSFFVSTSLSVSLFLSLAREPFFIVDITS